MLFIVLGISLLTIAILLVLFALSLSISFFFGPPFVPTPKYIVIEMLTLAKTNKKDVVIDLGSGDGVVLIQAAKMGAHAKGWETNPFLVVITLIKARLLNLNKKIEVHNKSYQKAVLKDATIIFCYNLPKFMKKISKKMKKELPKNAKVISYKFPIPGLHLDKKTQSGIFLYTLKK